MRIITILGTQGCHLCEEMWWQLEPHSGSMQWRVEQKDIAYGPDADRLITEYGMRIPVLCYRDHEFTGHLTSKDVLAWLVEVDRVLDAG